MEVLPLARRQLALPRPDNFMPKIGNRRQNAGRRQAGWPSLPGLIRSFRPTFLREKMAVHLKPLDRENFVVIHRPPSRRSAAQLASPRVGLHHRRSACDAFPPRDIEVVVESALSLVVVVSALWNWRFRCRFPPLRFGVFRHWTFVFCGAFRRAALASAWASSTVLMRCHSFVGGARPTWK